MFNLLTGWLGWTTLNSKDIKIFRSKKGYLYIAVCEEMKGLVKIGKTKRDDVEKRMKELSKVTSTPQEFKCYHSFFCEDVDEVEKRAHILFQAYRVNKKREFFFEKRQKPPTPHLQKNLKT